MPVAARGNMDKRVGMSADLINHGNGATHPWWVAGATAQEINIAAGMGLAADAALVDAFSFSHIVFCQSADQAAAPTVLIKYRVPGGGTDKTITLYVGVSAGMYVIPVGFVFPVGATFCSVEFAGVASGTGVLLLQGVN